MHKINLKPIPVNQCWRGQRYKTSEYKAWREEAYYRLKNLRLERTDGFVGIEFHFYLKHALRTDLTNCHKAVCDALVDAQVIEDDSKILREESFKHKSKEDYFTFNVYELEDEEITRLGY